MVEGGRDCLCTAQIGGIPAKAYEESDEQWIELIPVRSLVDLSGWRLSEDIDFVFPVGTQISPAEYLVVARGCRGSGPASSRYSGGGATGRGVSVGVAERDRLLDAVGNPADDVRYFDD